VAVTLMRLHPAQKFALIGVMMPSRMPSSPTSN